MSLHLMRMHVVSSIVTAFLTTTSTRWTPQLWGVLLTVSLVVGLDALDVSMVGVALPVIQADLGLSTSALQWVVSGYVLSYGGLLLLGGGPPHPPRRGGGFPLPVAPFPLPPPPGGGVRQ